MKGSGDLDYMYLEAGHTRLARLSFSGQSPQVEYLNNDQNKVKLWVPLQLVNNPVFYKYWNDQSLWLEVSSQIKIWKLIKTDLWNCVFATNLNLLNPISLQPDGVNLDISNQDYLI